MELPIAKKELLSKEKWVVKSFGTDGTKNSEYCVELREKDISASWDVEISFLASFCHY